MSKDGRPDLIDVDNDLELARWAKHLCVSPEEVREAVKAVGPDPERVKRHLFVRLARDKGKPPKP